MACPRGGDRCQLDVGQGLGRGGAWLACRAWLVVGALAASAASCTLPEPLFGPAGDGAPAGGDRDGEPGVIQRVQLGQFLPGAEVLFEGVVSALEYTLDQSFNPSGIKGFFIAEPLPIALPFGGIYVRLSPAESVGAFEVGERLAIRGSYSEYFDMSQIEPLAIMKLGPGSVPAPAVVANPASIATLFAQIGGEWQPTNEHGVLAEIYEGVLVRVENVEITTRDVGHGQFEVSGHLVIDKQLHYYQGARDVGTRFDSITGILLYTYEAFKLAPRNEADLVVEGSSTGPGEVTIKDIQSGQVAAGTRVSIPLATIMSGVLWRAATEGGSLASTYVSDGTSGDYSGVYVYRVKAGGPLAYGDEVSIVAQVTLYSGQWELQNVSTVGAITATGQAGTVPGPVSTGFLGDHTIDEAMRGSLVRVADLVVTAAVDSYGDLTVASVYDAVATLKVRNDFLLSGSLAGYTVGQAFTSVTGIFDRAFGADSLFVLDLADMSTDT